MLLSFEDKTIWSSTKWLARRFKVRSSIMSHHLCLLFKCGLVVKKESGASRFYGFNQSSGLSFKDNCLTLVLREVNDVT